MDDGLKQRIVGAVVLLALLVLFLPVLFDRTRVVPVDQTSQIPARPVVPPAPIPQAVAPQVAPVDTAPPPRQMFIPDETKPQKLDPEIAKLNSRGAPVSWVLQIASYRSGETGKKMRDDLLAKGFNAYLREIKTPTGVISRVFVGPKLDKKAILEAKKRIDESYKLNTVVLEFTPA